MSPTTAEIIPISIDDLLLDLINPRIEEQDNQREAIRAIIREQGQKIVNLAEDIVTKGLSAAELFMVIKTDEDDTHFIVVDGNRRLTALKILNEPELASDLLTLPQFQRLNELSNTFEPNQVNEVIAALYPDRETADIWIERRHQADLHGVGQESWGAIEKQRFAKRQGIITPTMQVLDFVREHGNLTPEEEEKLKTLFISNLTRIINDKHVRNTIGLRLVDNQFLSSFIPTEAIKPLKKIVLDVAYQRVNVTQLEKKEDRKRYIDRFALKDLPAPKKRQAVEVPLLVLNPDGKPAVAKPKNPSTTTGGGRPAVRRERSTLIPKNCSLHIADDRIYNIYKELQQLSADDLPNAAAILFRVFLELSLDDFVEYHNIIASAQERRNTKLANKLTKVADWMRDQNIMTDQELAPVRRASSDSNMLAASITTLHQYVHNRHFSPIPSELRTSWDDLQPFMEKLWATRP